MASAARYLITTADERSWVFDQPVLFLGEWCRLFDRREVWQEMDGVVAAPFGVDKKQQNNDIDYTQDLSKILLDELTDALNAFHKTNHSARYWNVTLGHWLNRYVTVCFNRYFTIQQALAQNQISGTTVFKDGGLGLVVPDSVSFIWAANDDVWNNILYSRILSFINVTNFEIDSVSLETKKYSDELENSGLSIDSRLKGKLRSLSSKMLEKLEGNRDALIVTTYLPRKEEIKLQLALGQVPQLRRSEVLMPTSVSTEDRKSFSINSAHCSGFEKFIRDLLPDVIPTCYLEGFRNLTLQASQVKWPNRPKFIFTSNDFDTNEIFKAWTAKKIEQGTPYYVGQHGNNYGTKWGSNNYVEQVTPDKFITWGWTNGSEKNLPAFNFKLANNPRTSNPFGGLLLIEVCAEHRIFTGDTWFEFGKYQENQFEFVEALPENLRKELTVRLHSSWRLMRWSEEQRWKERLPGVELDFGITPIQRLVADSRIAVYSYDSTGILEGLASNIPTLGFWEGGFNHLLPLAKVYYQMLRDVGIIADGPTDAAAHIAHHWGDIGNWWYSKEVQDVRQIFCEQYARTVKYPVLTLKQLLKD